MNIQNPLTGGFVEADTGKLLIFEARTAVIIYQ